MGGAVKYPWEAAETNVHDKVLNLAAFAIDKFPVTNRDYKVYLEETGYIPRDTTNWLKSWTRTGGLHFPRGHDKKTVTWINMQEAMDFCAWRGARLPQSFEWQLAAQDLESKRVYPWGNTV